MKEIINHKIEKNVPMPPKMKESKWAKLIIDMELGDSIYFESVDMKKQIGALRIAGKKRGMKFAQRKQSEGIRVWRIA